MIYKLTKEEFRRMQLIELDLLVEFDRVCRKHGIKYTICAGTQLGGVRHNGFIPWDDDIDVSIMREDYERFKEEAMSDLDKSMCFFQDHTTDPFYRWGYAKLRYKGTTYIRDGQEHCNYKTGVFIDIIPIDDVPNNLILQILQDWYCFCIRKMLWSEVGKNIEKGLLRLWYRMLSVIPTSVIFKMMSLVITKKNNHTPNKVRGLMFPAPGIEYGTTKDLSKRYGMLKYWFTTIEDCLFEGKTVMGMKYADEYLKYKYGNYMKLPPEDKREGHAPVSFIDLGGLHTEIENKIEKNRIK